MKTEDEAVNENKAAWDRAYASDMKKLKVISEPIFLVLLAVVVLTLSAIFVFPSVFKAIEASNRSYDYIKSEYGAQDVSWSKFGLNIDVGGKTLLCERPTEEDRAAHAPIQCGGGVTLRSNKASNQ
jgi:hypothetical protein